VKERATRKKKKRKRKREREREKTVGNYYVKECAGGE